MVWSTFGSRMAKEQNSACNFHQIWIYDFPRQCSNIPKVRQCTGADFGKYWGLASVHFLSSSPYFLSFTLFLPCLALLYRLCFFFMSTPTKLQHISCGSTPVVLHCSSTLVLGTLCCHLMCSVSHRQHM